MTRFRGSAVDFIPVKVRRHKWGRSVARVSRREPQFCVLKCATCDATYVGARSTIDSGVEVAGERGRNVAPSVEDAPYIHVVVADEVERQNGESCQRADSQVAGFLSWVTGRSGEGSFDCVNESQRDVCARLIEVVVGGSVEVDVCAFAEPDRPGSHDDQASDRMRSRRDAKN
jgi:hypothetical protein